MNVTQAVDAYIDRELAARCNHNKGQLRTAELELVKRLKRNIQVPPEAYLLPERIWRKFECISLVGIEFITSWSVNQMSEEYCKELLSLIRHTIKKPAFPIVSIHDCFKTLPNYMNYVRQTYVDIMAELADSRTLDAILTDIAGVPIHIPKLSSNLSDLIRKSEYLLS